MSRTTTGARVAQFCAVALLCVSAVPAQLLKPRDVDVIAAAPPDRVIAYGSDPNQFGQLFLPKGRGQFPVAVVIHGGCWKKFADLKNTAPMSDALRKAGIATWNIEYRRVDNEGGGWPGTYLDIAAAIDHLRTLAREHRLDMKEVITVEHSAGGHLALWAAARRRLTEESPLYVKNPLPHPSRWVIDDQRIKFEIVLEARIDLAGEMDKALGVPVLSLNSAIAEKFLANTDRAVDESVQGRDLIDLAFLAADVGKRGLYSGLEIAEEVYGGAVRRNLAEALRYFQAHKSRADGWIKALQISDTGTLRKGLRVLRSL